MIDPQLRNKLTKEESLTAAEALQLDAMLEGSKSTQTVVASLEDPALSLAWRSSLNEKMLKHSQRRRATKWWGFASSAAVAAASLYAIIAILPTSSPSELTTNPRYVTTAPNRTEGALYRVHNESVVQASLGVTMPSDSGSSPFDWSTIESL